MQTSLANICTNFMLIKIRLLRQAWLLSHSYDYCLDLWYYKRKGKACSRRVMVVNFSREGFSLQFFSINDCCMNGLQGLLKESVDPLGNPCHNTDAGFFLLCSSDFKNCLIFLSGFSLPPQKSAEIAGNFFFFGKHSWCSYSVKHKRKWKICCLPYGENPSSLRLFLPLQDPNTL